MFSLSLSWSPWLEVCSLIYLFTDLLKEPAFGFMDFLYYFLVFYLIDFLSDLHVFPFSSLWVYLLCLSSFLRWCALGHLDFVVYSILFSLCFLLDSFCFYLDICFLCSGQFMMNSMSVTSTLNLTFSIFGSEIGPVV